mgnify:CR=1 FL=1
MIFTNGSLGIGLGNGVAPNNKLHVEGKTYLDGNVGIKTAPHSTYALDVAGDTKINGGNVGIGTNPDSTTPYALNVAGDVFINGDLSINGNLTVTGNLTVNGKVFFPTG